MRFAIVGERSFAVAVTKRLLERDHELVGVWSRDERMWELAARRATIWDSAPSVAKLKYSGASVLLSVHNFELVPEELLDVPRHGVLGYHPSLLPRHRGADAVRWTIEAGDPIAGGTVYQLDGGWDTGLICRQDWCHVDSGWDASALWREELFPMGLRLVEEELAAIEAGTAQRREQDERFATFGCRA